MKMQAIIKSKYTKGLLTAAIASSFFTGCASYKASSLSSLYHDEFQAPTESSSQVVVKSKVFSREDCKRYLDRDVISEGYQPVQVSILNNTDRRYYFSTDKISVPVAKPQEVAETVHTSTVVRAVGYGVGALFVWPLLIPAIVDGIGSAEANTALDSDFAMKSAKDQTIQPYSRLNTLLFIPVDGYKDSFSITLVDEKNNEPTTLVLSN